jgi:hypothetical protein
LCRLERRLDPGSIEEPEGYIQRLAEASVGVVVDISLVHHYAHPQLASRRGTGVITDQEPVEGWNHLVHQQNLGCPVRQVDKREEAVAAVDELVAMARVDFRGA